MKKSIVLIFMTILISISGALSAAAATDVEVDLGDLFTPVVTEKAGDLNSDGSVDVGDAILLLQHSMFPTLYPIEYKKGVDFTCDGVVDVNDAILLLQHSMFPELYPLQ